MTSATLEQYVDIDAFDPADAAHVELAIASAISEALGHPTDARLITAEGVERILDAIAGPSMRHYAQRVLTAFAREYRGDITRVRPEDLEEVSKATERAVTQAIDQTGESVRDIVRTAAERARAARPLKVAGTPTPVTEWGLNLEAEAYSRLRNGMESTSRLLTTRTRELSKEIYATRLGATGKVWRTMRDTRVRTSHGDLEGDFVLIGQTFTTIRGNELRRPGDGSAPLSETINCRCRLSYRMPVSE